MGKKWSMAAKLSLAVTVALSGYATAGIGQSKAEEALSLPSRLMENLNRAPVAVKTDNGVFVGWRMLGTDSQSIAFNLYRDGVKVNTAPIVQSTNYLDPNGTVDSTYQVRAVLSGVELPGTDSTGVWSTNSRDIPLRKPAGGVSPVGDPYTYHANDLSVGDLDGDGQYELIVKWDPSNSKDNSQSGYTGNVYVDAYKLDGTFLWRIDLGRNIRAGAHYTQFLVYDFDGDGRAELVAKTADGTVDGGGAVIGDPNADYRNTSGYVLSGPEYLTVFDGLTGRAMSTVDYDPPRGNVNNWGDNYGNRVDRFLAAVAYLDGERPSIVMARGYYTRSVLAAYNWRDGKLEKQWTFDSDNEGNSSYAGQGNHNLSVADVDGDGKDEIIYGAATIDHDGKGLYNTRLGHGDALHVSDLDPSRPGLEVFKVQESRPSPAGIATWDAATGELLWGIATDYDVGRGAAGDIDPRYPGMESWAVGSSTWNDTAGGIYTTKGEKISSRIPPANFVIWWDGDLLREILDHTFDESKGVGVGRIAKWDYENEQTNVLLNATGTYSNNSTKGTPNLQADLLGDWREEVIWRLEDSSALRLYTTTDVTEHRIYTLMHDPVYRLSIAWQNVGYNQPPHTGFYLGTGMSQAPVPNIVTELGVGAVHGWVDNGSGKRLGGAVVTLQAGGKVYSTTTNAHGYYSFHQIPSTSHALLMAANLSCTPGTAIVQVAPNGSKAQDLSVHCAIESVSIDPPQKTVLLGNTLQLSAQISPDYASQGALVWSSSNPAVVSVDSNGLVTALAMGQATISVHSTEAPSLVASSEITVVGIKIESFELDKSVVNVLIGASQQLHPMINPENASNRNIVWTSSDPAVAEVDSHGKITGIAVGTATITATTEEGGHSRTATVNVQSVQVPVASVKMESDAYYMASDYFSELNPITVRPTLRVKANVLPANATNNDVTWTSSDPSVATVDEFGTVTALQAGVAQIRATTVEGGHSATTNVYVPVISESFSNRVTGDVWGSRTGTAGGSGNLGGAVAVVSGNQVFQVSGGGSGVRSTQRAFTAPIKSDRVLLDFDWHVGAPTNTPGAQLSFEDSNGQRYLTLQYTSGQEMIYGSGGTASNTLITGTPVGSGFNVNNTLYRVRVELDFVKGMASLKLENKNNPAIVSEVSGIPFDANTTYKNDLGKIQFTLVRQSGQTTSWTSWVDNFNVYGMSSGLTAVTSAAIHDSEGNAVNGTTLTLEQGQTNQLVAVVEPAGADVRSVTWSSSQPEIASVDPASGLVTAVSLGQAEIQLVVDGYAERGGAVITKTVTIQVVAVNEPGVITASVTGPQAAAAGEDVELTVSVTGAVYSGFRAADVTVHYDPSTLEFELESGGSGGFRLAPQAIQSLRDGLQVIGTSVRPNEGKIRIIMVSVETEAMTGDGGLFTLKGKVSEDAAIGAAAVSLSDFLISSDGDEKAVDVSGAIHTIMIEDKEQPVDADKSGLIAAISVAQAVYDQAGEEGTKLGQYRVGSKAALMAAIAAAGAVRDNVKATQDVVNAEIVALNAAVQHYKSQYISMVEGSTRISLGDLSIAVKHYGATSSDPNWSSISAVDLFDEGEITLRSLVAIARMILSDWIPE
jgi:uncharacterized protein YjdB